MRVTQGQMASAYPGDVVAGSPIRICAKSESEPQRSRMANHHVARLGGAAGADLAECGAGLLDQDVDDMSGPAAAQRTEAPQESLAGECRLGAERKRPRHVGAAADARVHHHGGAAADP